MGRAKTGPAGRRGARALGSRPAEIRRRSASPGSTAIRTRPCSGTAATRAATGSALRGHGGLGIELSDCDNQKTFLAVTGNDYFAVFQDCFQTVQAQVALRSLFAMTAQARGFEQW